MSSFKPFQYEPDFKNTIFRLGNGNAIKALIHNSFMIYLNLFGKCTFYESAFKNAIKKVLITF